MALPGDITTIILTGTYLDMEGNPRSGTVTLTPSTPILVDTSSSTILGAVPVTVALNSSGAFSVVLPCTSGLLPSGWLWGVTEAVSGTSQRSYSIALPSTLGSTVDISTLTPQGTPGTTSRYLLASQLGAANGAAELNGSGLLPVTEGGTGAGTAAAALAGLGGLPLPSGSATVGYVPTVTATSPLALDWSLGGGGTWAARGSGGSSSVWPLAV